MQRLQTLLFLQIYRNMQNTINTYSQVLKFIPALMQHKALGSLYKNSLPQWEKLSEYRCQMVVDQYENEDGQFAQECRLQFLHKKNGIRFSINITDLSYVKNTSYLFEWSKQSQQDANVILSDEISLRMSANCLNYSEYLKKEEISAKYQQKLKRQQTTVASVKSQFGKKSGLIKKQYSKKQLINRADDVKKQNSEGSDFGSWVEEEFQQPKKKVEVASYKPSPSTEKNYFDYRGYDDRNLIDYSQSTKINVRFKLLQFLRVKENRKKKIPEIRQYLRRCNYNVPEKPLKELIKDLCLSHLMDRNKGYMLKDEYLSKQEIAQRQEQHQKQLLEKKEREKKKRSKKQTKTQLLHQSFADTLSEVKSRFSASKKKVTK